VYLILLSQENIDPHTSLLHLRCLQDCYPYMQLIARHLTTLGRAWRNAGGYKQMIKYGEARKAWRRPTTQGTCHRDICLCWLEPSV
jgi:hypothetical protein